MGNTIEKRLEEVVKEIEAARSDALGNVARIRSAVREENTRSALQSGMTLEEIEAESDSDDDALGVLSGAWLPLRAAYSMPEMRAEVESVSRFLGLLLERERLQDALYRPLAGGGVSFVCGNCRQEKRASGKEAASLIDKSRGVLVCGECRTTAK